MLKVSIEINKLTVCLKCGMDQKREAELFCSLTETSWLLGHLIDHLSHHHISLFSLGHLRDYSGKTTKHNLNKIIGLAGALKAEMMSEAS